MKKELVNFDCAIDVKNGTIVPNGENESGFFLNMLRDNETPYKIVEEEGPGGGWPNIDFEVSRTNCIPLFVCMDPCGLGEDEIRILLNKHEGTLEEFVDLYLC